MPFKRELDSSYPYTWVKWEADGVTWTIGDLRPEDDDEAIKLLEDNFCADEVLCSNSNLMSEPESIRGMTDFWRICLKERMSLGCYVEKDGAKKLVGLNVCVVMCRGDEPNYVITGKAWQNVYNALKVCDKVDVFKLLGVDIVLYGFGLVVAREYRAAKLGSKILAAREPLALHHCITTTSTVFTGPASQRSAEYAGFHTILSVNFKELVEVGLQYPPDEKQCIKLMVKRYDHVVERN